MLAWGLSGYMAALMARPLKKSRVSLLLYGALSGVGYSMIMDIWTVLWYNGTWSLPLYGAALVTALPHTLLYAVSNVIFLALFERPFGRKLSRLCLKYGI